MSMYSLASDKYVRMPAGKPPVSPPRSESKNIISGPNVPRSPTSAFDIEIVSYPSIRKSPDAATFLSRSETRALLKLIEKKQLYSFDPIVCETESVVGETSYGNATFARRASRRMPSFSYSDSGDEDDSLVGLQFVEEDDPAGMLRSLGLKRIS